MDPFVTDDNTGYKPDKFYTSHGDRPSDSREVNIKMDPLQYDLLHRYVLAPENKFGQYKGLSDFIADSVHHRLHWLMTEYPQLDSSELRKDLSAIQAAFTQRTTATRNITRLETIRRLEESIDRAGDLEDWSDEDSLVSLLDEARQMARVASDKDRATLLALLRRGDELVRNVRASGQLQLSDALEDTATVINLQGGNDGNLLY